MVDATGKELGGTLRSHERLGFAYDAAGNLNWRTNNALVQTFTVNSLNQLSNATRSGTLTVAGVTHGPANSVTVSSNSGSALTAERYADNTYSRTNSLLTNGNNTFTAVATDSSGCSDTNAIIAYLPSTASYQYDLNSNLIFDGLRGMAYDDENQLTRITVTNSWKSEFTYDGKMRRRIRREYSWRNSAWVMTAEVRYIYDGNLVIQERDQFNVPKVTYTRGKDLSGGLEGAGGIGGLLARTDNDALAVADARPSVYYTFDGNGNVTCLVDTNQSVVGRYIYDPFGNTLAATGPAAEANLYRFSSKELHAASRLVYYLYRYYDPNLQRWPNRDPIGERGGINLYRFANNAAIQGVDAYGLSFWDYIPIIGTLTSCFGTSPGERLSDFASVPSPSCEDCKFDSVSAETKCENAINSLARGYGFGLVAPGVVKFGVDAIVAGLGTISVVGVPIAAGAAIDGIVGAACSIKTVFNIYNTAKEAKEKFCKCPSQR